MNYVDGYVTDGSYFTYEGVRYGGYTKVLLTNDAFKRNGENKELWHPHIRTFHSIGEDEDGNEVWNFCLPNFAPFYHTAYYDFIPERDIVKIVTPVYYMKPRELVKLRLSNWTWPDYIWKQTLLFILCLLISPLFQEGYLIWTQGLLYYLISCYRALSKGELNSGW